jgi:hypothetical protein
VAVCGGSVADPAQLEAAEAVGRLLAERDAVVVTGGRGGVMEAACRGAKAGGGTTLGILPGYERADANEFVDVGAADAVVAVGGEWGTLSEIALALRAGKRVVGLGTWELPDRGGRGIVAAASPEEAVELALTAASAG